MSTSWKVSLILATYHPRDSALVRRWPGRKTTAATAAALKDQNVSSKFTIISSVQPGRRYRGLARARGESCPM